MKLSSHVLLISSALALLNTPSLATLNADDDKTPHSSASSQPNFSDDSPQAMQDFCQKENNKLKIFHEDFGYGVSYQDEIVQKHIPDTAKKYITNTAKTLTPVFYWDLINDAYVDMREKVLPWVKQHNISILSARQKNLTVFPPALRTTPSLVVIDASENKIAHAPFLPPNLRLANFWKNQITEFSEASDTLEVLILSGNRRLKSVDITKLTALESLYVDEGVKIIGDLSKVEVVRTKPTDTIKVVYDQYDDKKVGYDVTVYNGFCNSHTRKAFLEWSPKKLDQVAK